MIHLNYFYPTVKINSGSELYYVAELNKYLKNYGEILSIEGIAVNKRLVNSEFWNYFISSKIYGTPVDVLSHPSRNEGHIYTTNLAEVQPVFSLQTPQQWVFNMYGKTQNDEIHNISLLNGTLRSQAWVSLIALVAVHRCKMGIPANFVLDLSKTNVFTNKMSVADIQVLQSKSSALNGWFTLVLPQNKDVLNQLSLEGYIHHANHMGYMNKFYSVAEKQSYFKKKFTSGDVVLLYERAKGQEVDSVKSIETCWIAVINRVTKSNITLNVLSASSMDTILTSKKYIESLPYSAREKFVGESYRKTYVRENSFSWIDIGIEYATYKETYFITPLSREDGTNLWLTDGTREINRYFDTIEATYAILKDREVPFNEKLFLQRYYQNGRVPLYDVFMQGGNI